MPDTPSPPGFEPQPSSGESSGGLDLLPDGQVNLDPRAEESDSSLRVETSEPTEPVDKALEGQKLRARVLREDPAIHTAMTVVRRTPDIWQEVQPVLRRRQELIAGTQGEGERHRNFAPLLAGVELSERGSEIMDIAMDRSFEAQSDWLKAEAAQGHNYVHEVVIGSGQHSAIYNSTRMAEAPGHPALVVEKESKVGGQFALPKEPVFYLNSRNRPENIDLPHRPGTEGSLNTHMEGVVQPSDLSGLSYAPQDTLARSARINNLMASRVMVDADASKVIKQTDPELPGAYLVEMTDPQTGEVTTIATDRVIWMTGAGEAKGIEGSNRRTGRILKQETEKFERGERPQVVTGEQYLEMIGDPSKPFPLEGIKRVIVVGTGDTGRVAVGSLLGHETQLGKTVAQLDRVEEVVWIGQTAKTKEEFERQERQRYRDSGLDFPRAEFPDYYHRVTPQSGRAVSLDRRDDGRVVLTYQDGFARRGESGDLIILNTGFKDGFDEVLSEFEEESRFITDTDEIVKTANEILRRPESYLLSNDGVLLYVREVAKNEASGETEVRFVVSFRDELGDPRDRESAIPISDIDETLTRYFGDLSKIVEARLAGISTDDRPEVYDRDGIPIARKLRNEEIYFAGPVANLPLTEQEKQESPVAARISENSAAIFRYAERTAALAKLLIESDGPLPDDLVAAWPDKRVVELPEAERGPGNQVFAFAFEPDKYDKLSYKAVSEDLLRFAIAERLFAYRVPEGFDRLELRLQRTGDTSYEVSEGGNQLGSEEYRKLVGTVLQDPVVQLMIQRLTEKSVTISQLAELVIPFAAGKVDLENISARSVRVPKRPL